MSASLVSLGLVNKIMNGATWIPNTPSSVTYAVGNIGSLQTSILNGTRSYQMTISMAKTATTDAPYASGLGFYMKAVRGPFWAADWAYPAAFQVDGSSLVDLAWGTAAASAVTLSFWYKSNLTGNHWVALTNGGTLAQHYEIVFNVPDTAWRRYVFTVAGPTTGTWVTAYGSTGIIVTFLNQGTTEFAATNQTWQACTSFKAFAPATGLSLANWYGSSTNEMCVTGVQLEAGSVANPVFDSRPYLLDKAMSF